MYVETKTLFTKDERFILHHRRHFKICFRVEVVNLASKYQDDVRFYDMLNIPAEYGNTSSAKFTDISRQLLASLLGVCCNQRALVDDTGMIITQM
jgi:hypothetical protein